MFVNLHAVPPKDPKKLCGRILCPAFRSFMANSESTCTLFYLSGDLLPILCHQNLRGLLQLTLLYHVF